MPFATFVTLPSITTGKTISDMKDVGKYIEISHHMKLAILVTPKIESEAE